MLLEDQLETSLDLIFELRGRDAIYRAAVDGNETQVRAIKGNPQLSLEARAFAAAPMRETHAVAILVREIEHDPASGDVLTFLDNGESFTVRAPATRTADGRAWWPVRLVPVA